MPSPFPGMDPYLEAPLWRSFHHLFATRIVDYLQPRLGPRYVAIPEQEFVLAPCEEIAVATSQLRPDVSVASLRPRPSGTQATATLQRTAPLRFTAPLVAGDEKFLSVEIRDTLHRQLVTAIELLSPTNKSGSGRGQYLARRHRLLAAGVNLLEIDLQRQGLRVPTEEQLPSAPYFVFLTRWNQLPTVEGWPIQLSEPLPTVPVPLLPADGDVALSLQEALAAAYDSGAYERQLDYREPPKVPLTLEEREWTQALLAEHGFHWTAAANGAGREH